MEDHLQVLLIVIISSILMFIFPVYIAYEKKDDISYALALKYTQEFVKSVSEKGYITKDDYDVYRNKLTTTGNMYDIQMEHKHANVSPSVKLYKGSSYSRTITIKNLEEAGCSDTEKKCTIGGELYNIDIVQTRQIENYGTSFISKILKDDQEFTYIMNKGDSFSVIIKNTNTTFATMMYNMVSLSSNKTRIYVNCARKVTDESWHNKNIKLAVTDEVLKEQLLHAKEQETDTDIIGLLYKPAALRSSDSITSDGFSPVLNYTISGKFNPEKAIDIKEVGDETELNSAPDLCTDPIVSTPEYIVGTGYYAIKGLYVGVNGVVVRLVCSPNPSVSNFFVCALSYQGTITQDTLIEVAVRLNTLALFINGKRVSDYSLPYNYKSKINSRKYNQNGLTSVIEEFKIYRTG